MSIAIENLITQLCRLPGIGRKTATRLAFYILKQPESYSKSLASALYDIKQKVGLCSICLNLAETDPCEICSNTKRDPSVVCVIEDPSDIIAIERTHQFCGRYHILHGNISPLDGVGPDDIKIKELVDRVKSNNISEIIIATNASVEGETTALYISKILKQKGVKLTRIASGIPIGSDIEFVDPSTLSRAFEARREL